MAGMLVIRVSERSTRHQVLRDVFGYHDNTVRKLPMDAEHNKSRQSLKKNPPTTLRRRPDLG